MLSDEEERGGAAIAASRSAAGFVKSGHEVIRLVNTPGGYQDLWKVESLRLDKDSVAVRAAKRVVGPLARDRWTHAQVTGRLTQILKDICPDVINVHNLHGANWPPDLSAACAAAAPTVWTLHDMWSFTGRCAYSYACRKFITGCDADCPTAEEYPALPRKRISRAWQSRELLFRDTNLVAVAPSKWLRAEALSGLWNGHRVDCIPYGLPLHVYKPEDRQMARQAVGLNQDSGPVLLVAADNLSDPRKGMPLLTSALGQLRRRDFTLLVLGRSGDLSHLGSVVHSLGFVDDERTRVLAYNAADALVHPASADNLPNVVIEAIACGTPTISFPVGGLTDLVRPGITGWLADNLAPSSLAATMDAALRDLESGLALRESSRRVAEQEYSVELQSRRYNDLFQELVSGNFAKVRPHPIQGR